MYIHKSPLSLARALEIIGLKLLNIYRVLEFSSENTVMDVSLQQCGNVPPDFPIDRRREPILPYEDFTIEIITRYGGSHLDQINFLYYDRENKQYEAWATLTNDTNRKNRWVTYHHKRDRNYKLTWEITPRLQLPNVEPTDFTT